MISVGRSREGCIHRYRLRQRCDRIGIAALGRILSCRDDRRYFVIRRFVGLVIRRIIGTQHGQWRLQVRIRRDVFRRGRNDHRLGLVGHFLLRRRAARPGHRKRNVEGYLRLGGRRLPRQQLFGGRRSGPGLHGRRVEPGRGDLVGRADVYLRARRGDRKRHIARRQRGHDRFGLRLGRQVDGIGEFGRQDADLVVGLDRLALGLGRLADGRNRLAVDLGAAWPTSPPWSAAPDPRHRLPKRG